MFTFAVRCRVAMLAIAGVACGLVSLQATIAAPASRPTFDSQELEAYRGKLLPLSLDELGEASPLGSRRVYAMVELEDPPTAVVLAQEQQRGVSKAGSMRAAQAHLARVRAAQHRLVSELAKIAGTRVIYSVQRVFNGIAVHTEVAAMARLRELPGVSSVRVLREELPSNSTSVPFLGTPGVWTDLGFDGSGISIGIIDSGVDYLHSNFGGSGSPADYAANDTTVLDAFFPTAKVVGGFDFSGDDYNASDPANNVPQPDPDPLDCNGHGTHVAGTAAGLGVRGDGTTFPGPYDDTIDFAGLRIGPGTAPGAELYALRVFGCSGSTILVPQAIEWAVDPDGDGDLSDHLDVINMSLGSGFGGPLDASAVASDNAALAGVVVVAAAGNAGDAYFVSDSPGVAGRVLSVAASVDDGLVAPRARVNAPAAIAGDYLVGAAAFGPPLTAAGVTGDVAAAFDDDADGTVNTDGCSALSNPADVAGKIALIDRGSCNFTVKVKNAQDAGAIAAIIVNNAGDSSFGLGGVDPTITIPSVGIGANNGNGIRAALGEGVNATLLLVPTPERADTLASFSSRGPARGLRPHNKPDIAAPGLTITSALVGDATIGGTFALNLNGTSMATPHVAGVLALLRQAHPDWTVEELKALTMNTANHDVFLGDGQTPPVYAASRVGAGRIDPLAAATSDVVAFDADNEGRVTVDFATQTVLGVVSEDRTVRVTNHGAAAKTFTLSYVPTADLPGVDVSLPGGTEITVPAHGTADVALRLTADASAMVRLPDRTIPLTQNGFPRHFLPEESGHLRLAADGDTLRVPVFAAPRPISDLRSARALLAPNNHFLLIRGEGVNTTALASPPIGDFSLLADFELQHISMDDPATTGLLDAADLAYVGVATDAPSVFALGGGVVDSVVYFGIATHGSFSTPNEVQYAIWIDNDFDGEPDRVLFNGDFGSAIGAGRSDVFITLLADLETGNLFLADFLNGVPAFLNTGVYDSSTLFLGVPTVLLGLDDGNSRFEYAVTATSREAGLADVTPTLTFDVAAPGLDVSDARGQLASCPCPGAPIWSGLGSNVPITVDATAMRNNRSLGALVLFTHNADPESRAQAVILGRRLRFSRDERASDLSINGFTYFAVDLPHGTFSPVRVSTSGGTGEVDLYVRRAYPPTQDAFDDRSANLGNDETLTFESPPGRVYVGLLSKGGYSEVTVSLDP